MRRVITSAIVAGILVAVGACDYPGVERSASELKPGLVNRGTRGEQSRQQLENPAIGTPVPVSSAEP